VCGKQRQAIVDQFQLGCLDVLVCTYGVGATGLTLTRSHRVVLLDRPWTPGDVMQAEDRVRRIGQVASEVFSYWVCGFPFDDKLDSMLQRKNQRSAKVIEGRECAMSVKYKYTGLF
jgi:SNF2 family DNA or RNA helicase